MWKKPTFIVNTAKVHLNIKKMQHKAVKSQVAFRPHFKTHQTLQSAELFREKGIHKIAVSSVTMANYFATHNWNDITIAFSLNLKEVNEIDKLASEIDLNLLVESAYGADFLRKNIDSKAGIFIKIDTGYRRTGLTPVNLDEVKRIIQIIKNSETLTFKGFLAHAGHTYLATSKKEIEYIYQSGIQQLNQLKSIFLDDFPNLIVSFGDTPSSSIINDLSGVDEIRPGNFVYYDVMQLKLGSCSEDEIACAVACPVVAVHNDRNEIVIYGGAVHLSKEFIVTKNGQKNYGLVTEIQQSGWSKAIEGAYVKSISQEHGVIFIPDVFINKFKPGDMIGILPVHSCLTANLLKEDTVLIS
jgi:D-serine deaminase-like pyridoxal phosphate-dependent protein